jgi:hypothetical protein
MDIVVKVYMSNNYRGCSYNGSPKILKVCLHLKRQLKYFYFFTKKCQNILMAGRLPAHVSGQVIRPGKYIDIN